MSLFPAYGEDAAAGLTEELSHDPGDGELERMNSAASLAMEVQLLASDSDAEPEAADHQASSPLTARSFAQTLGDPDYYVDDRLDRGNLRVSTLYYPGRPQYEYRKSGVGLRSWAGERRARRRCQRYYAAPLAADERADRAESAERERALRRLLDDRPHDPALWLNLIHFHEGAAAGAAALAAAEAGAARARGSRRLRAARYRLRRAHLSLDDTLERLRADLTEESGEPARRQTWAWLVETAGVRGGLEASGAACAAALRGAGGAAGAALLYPALVLAWGEVARAAGLQELLVLLLELLAAMCFPRTAPAAAFPPAVDAHTQLQRDARLHRYEDELIASGLPLGVVWARVERARAAAHWRPVGAGAEVEEDPQRAPSPADVADLLLPVRDTSAAFLLAVNMLRLAKVPPMGAAASALGEAGGCGEAGERVLALVRAARHLAPRHPARAAPHVARHALALLVDPPHYFTDDAGYLSWVNALWEACCSWFECARRSALVCWRLRWLHARALTLEPGDAALGDLLDAARLLLKGHPPSDPLPYAQLARLQAALGPRDAPRAAPRALRTALHALAAALRDPHVPPHHRLYIARVVREVCGARGGEGAWALCCAALGRPLPPGGQGAIAEPPPADLVRQAYETCVERCTALERQWEEEVAGLDGGEVEEDACARMLPAEGEWGVARVLLAPALHLPDIRARLHHAHAHAHTHMQHDACARYWSGSAAALAGRLAGRAWRSLARLHPGNTLLALGGSGAPLWAWRTEASEVGALVAAEWDALAPVLPPLYAALEAGWAAREASRVVSACRRAAAGAGAGAGGGCAVWAVRLEAEARAERPRCERAAVSALEAAPHCKWVYVRAALWAADAPALADLLLHKHMRLHTLIDELRPLPAAPAPRTDRDRDRGQGAEDKSVHDLEQ